LANEEIVFFGSIRIISALHRPKSRCCCLVSHFRVSFSGLFEVLEDALHVRQSIAIREDEEVMGRPSSGGIGIVYGLLWASKGLDVPPDGQKWKADQKPEAISHCKVQKGKII
jgi:hypothetical protein